MTLLAGIACEDGAAVIADTRSFDARPDGVFLEQHTKLFACEEVAPPVAFGATGGWVRLEEMTWPGSDSLEWSAGEVYKRMVIRRAMRAGLPSLDLVDELTHGDLLVAGLCDGGGVLGHLTPRGPLWHAAPAAVVAGSLLGDFQPPPTAQLLADGLPSLIGWARMAVAHVEAQVPADGVATVAFPLQVLSVDSGGLAEGVVNRE